MGKISVFLFVLLLANPLFAVDDFQIPTKNQFKKALAQRTLGLNQWIEKTNAENFDLICFGETHNDFFRQFESTKVVPFLKASVLAVEEDQENLQGLLAQTEEKELKITGASFADVADSYRTANPEGLILGIEASQQQKGKITFAQLDQINGKEMDYEPSRDGFIASNVDEILQTQRGVLAIYGANHCSYFSKGLGRDTPFVKQLANKYGDQKVLLNVHTLKEDESSILKVYLQEFELLNKNQDQVLFDTQGIDPEIYNYNLELYLLLQSYDVIIMPASQQ